MNDLQSERSELPHASRFSQLTRWRRGRTAPTYCTELHSVLYRRVGTVTALWTHCMQLFQNPYDEVAVSCGLLQIVSVCCRRVEVALRAELQFANQNPMRCSNAASDRAPTAR